MASLTDSRNTPRRPGDLRAYPVGDTPVYLGSIAALDTATGKLVPASATAGLVVVGRAERTVHAEGIILNVRRGVFQYVHDGSITAAAIGKPCYVVDDQTVTADAADGENAVNIQAGVVFDLDADGVWIQI